MVTYETCKRCYGRGYKPEVRQASKRNPNANGFYDRTCSVCGGSGRIPKENPGTRDEILAKMETKVAIVLAALKEAGQAKTENGVIGALAPIGSELIDLKALADALVALRR